jgi:hypothetical protein
MGSRARNVTSQTRTMKATRTQLISVNRQLESRVARLTSAPVGTVYSDASRAVGMTGVVMDRASIAQLARRSAELRRWLRYIDE